MEAFNIYLAGVGGQGIGMLSEILIRAADHAGLPVLAVDTHGLAQRGGCVVSQVRIGGRVNSPLIQAGQADLVVGLERHEALRAMGLMLKPAGVLIYCDVVWQPLDVRLGKAVQAANSEIDRLGRELEAKIHRIATGSLPDGRMQNVALLGHINKLKLIRPIQEGHYRRAMEDLMAGANLEANLELFSVVQSQSG